MYTQFRPVSVEVWSGNVGQTVDSHSNATSCSQLLRYRAEIGCKTKAFNPEALALLYMILSHIFLALSWADDEVGFVRFLWCCLCLGMAPVVLAADISTTAAASNSVKEDSAIGVTSCLLFLHLVPRTVDAWLHVFAPSCFTSTVLLNGYWFFFSLYSCMYQMNFIPIRRKPCVASFIDVGGRLMLRPVTVTALRIVGWICRTRCRIGRRSHRWGLGYGRHWLWNRTRSNYRWCRGCRPDPPARWCPWHVVHAGVLFRRVLLLLLLLLSVVIVCYTLLLSSLKRDREKSNACMP